MPRRASASELARLLAAAPQPVYAVDDAPRIVYLNRACAAWLGCADDKLLGQPCVYDSGHETTGALAVAAALCPPPDALAGRRMRASVMLPNGDAEDAGWTVEFVPLTTAGKPPAGVLCFVIGPVAPEAEEARDDDSPTQLHERIARFRRTLSNARYGDGLLGDSAAMRQVRSRIALAASTTASVVVIGPPGSGLQGVARAIHFGAKGEEAGPLVPLSCALLRPALVQSTLRALAGNELCIPPRGRQLCC
jgi:transcriptional regulator with PAS, ATPase and Fis domain